MNHWDLYSLVGYFEDDWKGIDDVINICDDYLEKKDKYIAYLKKFQEIKRIYELGLKFDSRKGRPRKWFITPIDHIKEEFDKGNVERVEELIEFEKEMLSNNASRTTMWRFKKRLKELGINI